MYSTSSQKRRGRQERRSALLLAAAVLAGGCGDDGVHTPAAFTLQLLHASDQEAGAAAVTDAPRFSAVINGLRALMPDDTLLLASGDTYIPGPFLSASEDPALLPLLGDNGPARADILIHNAMGFQASALGNHEFDLGPSVVRGLIARAELDDNGDGQPDRVFPGAQYPYLSSNLDFSASSDLMDLVVPDGQEAGDIPNSIAKSTVITVNGERIGVVGATTPTLPAISSPGAEIVVSPMDAADRAALAAIIQESVDALTATGINKIVLLSHMQQLAIERELATLVADVDIIVAGGSNTILADDTDRLRAGDSAVDTYPILSTSANNQPIAIVNTDGNYRYVGRLVAGFDADGVLLPGTIDPDVSGAYATDEEGVRTVGDPLPTPEVMTLASAVGDVLIERDSNLFGKTTVFLNGERRSVRTEQTNLGDISAEANLAFAHSFDSVVSISIKNGGGIRASIGIIVFPPGSTNPEDAEYLPPPANPLANKEEGQISQFDIQNSLSFNNNLALVTVTAAELQAIVEHAVAAVAPGATPGQFAQIAGMRFSFDPSLAPGARVRNLAVVDANGAITDVVIMNGTIQGDPARTFRVVTLGFLAGGGDSYPFPVGSAADRIDLDTLGLDPMGITFAAPGTEQHATALYLAARYPDATPYMVTDGPATSDEAIQNLSVRTDTVLDP